MIHWKLPHHPSRLRHPLVRLAAALLGIVAIVAVGLFALGALAIGAVVVGVAVLVRRFGRTVPAATTDTPQPTSRGAIDGEFVVIDTASTRQR